MRLCACRVPLCRGVRLLKQVLTHSQFERFEPLGSTVDDSRVSQLPVVDSRQSTARWMDRSVAFVVEVEDLITSTSSSCNSILLLPRPRLNLITFSHHSPISISRNISSRTQEDAPSVDPFSGPGHGQEDCCLCPSTIAKGNDQLFC